MAKRRKRAAELIIANKELAYQKVERGKRAAELIIANKELDYQNAEKGKRQEELILIIEELKKAKEYQKEYLCGLKEMMFMNSHKVRQPITQIMGIFHMLEVPMNSQEDLKKVTGYIKRSILDLDSYTRDFTTLIYDLEQKSISPIKTNHF